MKLTKIIILLPIIYILNLSCLNAKINILVSFDNEIITNHDIDKEVRYLELLNQNLISLDDNRKILIAKKSLINEKIKKKEIKKFIGDDLNENIIDDYLNNVYSKLNVKNKNEFKNLLNENQTYTLEEIKEKIEIELKWQRLIYIKFKDSVKIDKYKFVKKLDKKVLKNTKDFLLSEIIISPKKNLSLENTINQIRESIKEIGFNNSATIYSISDSAKLGGKLGWINENHLSPIILNEILKIGEGEITDLIKIDNLYVMLKIEKIKIKQNKIDKQKELEKMINIETNRQLDKFSKIYLMKVKKNININEK